MMVPTWLVVPALALVAHSPALTPCRPPRARRPVASDSAGLSSLKKLALTQAGAAAATIVETNTLLDPEQRQCIDCKPTQDALASQKTKLLPPIARAAIARTQLKIANKLLAAPDPLIRAVSMVGRVSTLALRGAKALVVSAGASYLFILLTFVVALLVPGIHHDVAPAVLPTRRRVDGGVLRIPLLLLDLELAWR